MSSGYIIYKKDTVLYHTRTRHSVHHISDRDTKLQFTIPPLDCSRDQNLTWFEWIPGMLLWFKMTVQPYYKHADSLLNYDQHNNSHSFRDLYFEINRVKESFKQWRLFPLHQWSAGLCQRLPGRSTTLNIISKWRLEQVLSNLWSVSSLPCVTYCTYGKKDTLTPVRLFSYMVHMDNT